MTVPEVMTLNIVRILDRTGDLKSFHKTASLHYRSYFPNLTNYENFMKASNKAVGFIASFIQFSDQAANMTAKPLMIRQKVWREPLSLMQDIF